MYYPQKRTIASILVSTALLTAYILYVLGKVNAGTIETNDVQYFAVTMLTFIGIGIGANIVVQILFHVLFSISVAVQERDKDEKAIETAVNVAMIEDERDKTIDLKSMRVDLIISMAGFVLGLVLLALDYSMVWMLNVTFAAVWLGSIGEGISKLIYYRIR